MMKRFAFSRSARLTITVFCMVAWTSFGAWALKPGDAQAQSANETRGMPTAAEEMPGSWGNIRVVDDPSPESSKDIDGTAQWNEIALSKDDDDAPDADVSQMQTKNRKEVDEELRKARDWNDIPTSTPRAAAVAPAPSKGLEFSTPGTTQTDEQYNAQGDPHKQSRTWLSRSPSQQISHDAQLRPLSGGGIFVPTMTGGHSEPKYQIYDANGKNVDEARTGTTTYVPAGKYTVHVGTPVSHDNLEFQVNVVEGDITVIPVEWSGLIVKVVNDRGTTIRGNYEIVSLPDRSYIGLGTGALLNEGEMLSTWLLWPGKYMIISAGEGYQARKNFITVSLDPGELSRLTLVVDEETGDILGGGEIDTVDDELLERWWWASILIGGSIRFNHTKDVIGKAPGQLLDVSGFLESYFSMALKHHYLYMRLNAEIGGTIRFEENRPFITSVDDLNFELLYSYRFIDWFGPYVRFAFESNMAPAYLEKSSPYTVDVLDKNGDVEKTKEQMLDVKLSPPFSPISLNTGAGGRVDVTAGSWLKFSSRIGIAYRRVIARDLFVVKWTDATSSILTLAPVDGSSQFGAEAAITLDLTPLRWFTLKTDLSIIEPFEDYKNPVIDLDVDAAIRLSSIASLSYTLRVNYDVSLIDKVQIDQYVQLRFSYKIY